jgi:hypothetical protein
MDVCVKMYTFFSIKCFLDIFTNGFTWIMDEMIKEFISIFTLLFCTVVLISGCAKNQRWGGRLTNYLQKISLKKCKIQTKSALVAGEN